jgi:hypothetical protein
MKSEFMNTKEKHGHLNDRRNKYNMLRKKEMNGNWMKVELLQNFVNIADLFRMT